MIGLIKKRDFIVWVLDTDLQMYYLSLIANDGFYSRTLAMKSSHFQPLLAMNLTDITELRYSYAEFMLNL